MRKFFIKKKFYTLSILILNNDLNDFFFSPFLHYVHE